MSQKDIKEAKEQANKQEQENTGFNIDINADENQAGTTHLNEPVTNESDIEKLQSELNEMKDKFVRKVAEFENFRKRNAKEKIELIQTAGKEVITSLLEVLDDSSRAEKQMNSTEDVKQIREGVMLVFTKFKNILLSKGLKPMETLNEEFNPDLHEAITEIPAPSDDKKGKVIDEIEKGYYLNDKIIRYAKVVVGK
jgi:molecular chaperone GrpE